MQGSSASVGGAVEVLPDFLINWIKNLEVLSGSKEGVREFKNGCYREISMYIIIIIIVTLIS